MRFTIYIVPVPKGRPRLNKFSKTIYTPKTTSDYENEIREAVIRQWGVDANYPVYPRGYPLRVDIDFVFPRPKRLMRHKDPDGLIWCDPKPDRDNLDKAVLDALKGVLWEDDCLPVTGMVQKFYAEKDGDPRVCIRVRTAGDPPTDTIDNWSVNLQDHLAGRKEGSDDLPDELR